MLWLVLHDGNFIDRDRYIHIEAITLHCFVRKTFNRVYLPVGRLTWNSYRSIPSDWIFVRKRSNQRPKAMLIRLLNLSLHVYVYVIRGTGSDAGRRIYLLIFENLPTTSVLVPVFILPLRFCTAQAKTQLSVNLFIYNI